MLLHNKDFNIYINDTKRLSWLQTWCLNEPDYVEYVDNLQFDF